MKRMLALWSAPRSASTAFEIMMQQRGDFCVYHEPFGVSYYNSEDRLTGRPAEGKPQPEHNYAAVWQRIQQQATTQAVFVKDLANHVTPLLNENFLAQFTNTFIIRHPAKSLPSLFNLWADFTLEETSCTDLYHMFELAQAINDAPPVVIDADDLIAEPEKIIRAYCQAVDIPFMSEALTWETGPRKELVYWDGGSWHKSVLKTTGFQKQKQSKYVQIDDDPHLQEAYAYCLPYYEKLYAYRLTG